MKQRAAIQSIEIGFDVTPLLTSRTAAARLSKDLGYGP